MDQLRDRRERLAERLGAELARLGHPRRVTKGMSAVEQLELIRVTYQHLMAAPRSLRAS